MFKKRLIFVAVIFFTLSIFLALPARADQPNSGHLYLSMGGGWGNYENGNHVYDYGTKYSRSRISDGPSYYGEIGLFVKHSISINAGLQYLTGENRYRNSYFLDDYIQWPDFTSYKIRLIAVTLKLRYTFDFGLFQMSPGIGISYLYGGIKYPIPEDPDPPPLSYTRDLNVSYKSNDWGYLASIRSSFRLSGQIFFDSEVGYRLFDIGMPHDKNGDIWLGSSVDFSGPYISCGLTYRLLANF